MFNEDYKDQTLAVDGLEVANVEKKKEEMIKLPSLLTRWFTSFIGQDINC